jgi:hypothetical protein
VERPAAPFAYDHAPLQIAHLKFERAPDPGQYPVMVQTRLCLLLQADMVTM